jgi:tRNA (guanine37-N1)-methyltransferase
LCRDVPRIAHRAPCRATRLLGSATTTTTTTSPANDEPFREIKSVPVETAPTAHEAAEEICHRTNTWRSLPALNPTVLFRSWIVRKGQGLQAAVQDPLFQPYLATRLDLLHHTQSRLKIIRDFPVDDEPLTAATSKLVLVHPDAPAWGDLPAAVRDRLPNGEGPRVPLTFTPANFTAAYLLHHALPEHVHPSPTAFESIGHVAHLNLRAPHVPYRYLIGQILVATLPTIETVIHKVGEVQGPYRTYDLEVLAGRPHTNVALTESGVSLHFDVKDVYWCSRLSEERARLLRQVFQPQQWVADVFCGVGALVLQAAKYKECRITANDWNPAAVAALRDNVVRNGVADRFVDIRCGEAYEFLMDLGTPDAQGQRPHHILMNYPLEAPSFLGALRWWPLPRRKDKSTDLRSAPRVHVYTFARADPATNRTAEQVAVDLIADELLPSLGDDAALQRRQELDADYDCDIQVHHVRDVAPGKLVLCVTFSATDQLLRCMQGDFS